MTTIIQRQRQTSQEKGAPLMSIKVSAHNIAEPLHIIRTIMHTVMNNKLMIHKGFLSILL